MSFVLKNINWMYLIVVKNNMPKGDNFKNQTFVLTGYFLKRHIQEISYLNIYPEKNIEPILNILLK